MIAAILMFSACAKNTTGAGDLSTITENSGLSTFISTDVEGNPVDQSIFESHTLTMVNIWATSCKPCISELPDLAKLNDDYAQQNIQVIGIVVDVPENDSVKLETAMQIIEQTGAAYVHILASENLREVRLNAVQYVPETIFVDALGNQVGESYVGSKDYDGWSTVIEELLSQVE